MGNVLTKSNNASGFKIVPARSTDPKEISIGYCSCGYDSLNPDDHRLVMQVPAVEGKRCKFQCNHCHREGDIRLTDPRQDYLDDPDDHYGKLMQAYLDQGWTEEQFDTMLTQERF